MIVAPKPLNQAEEFHGLNVVLRSHEVIGSGFLRISIVDPKKEFFVNERDDSASALDPVST